MLETYLLERVDKSILALPLSPPPSVNGSNRSSYRSLEDDLAREFSHIESGLESLKRATTKATKVYYPTYLIVMSEYSGNSIGMSGSSFD